jgi:hypothetical protein
MLQLKVTIGKRWGVGRQFRGFPEGPWRFKVCRRCDRLHVLVQGVGQRVTDRANDSLVRLCMTVGFGMMRQGGYLPWSGAIF